MTKSETERKIIEAAKKVFQEKGYGSARTRDIAMEAGINLALLNYYFRSKEKLFHLVMIESVWEFFQTMEVYLNNPHTSISEKVEQIVRFHHNLLSSKPTMPLFVLGEIQKGSSAFLEQGGIVRGYLTKTFLFQQIMEHLKKRGKKEEDLLNYVTNAIVMSVFPFVLKPIVSYIAGVENEVLERQFEERPRLVASWFMMMLDQDAS